MADPVAGQGPAWPHRALRWACVASVVLASMTVLVGLLLVAFDLVDGGDRFDGLGAFVGTVLAVAAACGGALAWAALVLQRSRPRAAGWLVAAVGAGVVAWVGLAVVLADARPGDVWPAVVGGLLLAGLGVLAARSGPGDPG